MKKSEGSKWSFGSSVRILDWNSWKAEDGLRENVVFQL
jgi:hypothetical protein